MTDAAAAPPITEPHKPRTSKLRSFAVGLLGVLAIVGIIASTLAVWTRVELFNSDKVADAAATTLDNPEVQIALGNYITDQLFTAVDVDQLVSNVLPGDGQRLEAVIARQAHTVVATQVAKVLATDQAQEVFKGLVKVSHKQLMKLLNGGSLGDFATVENGTVTLSLVPLVGAGLQSLQDMGLFTRVTLPDLSPGSDAHEQIAKLSAAIGRPLPENFGQLTVYQSDNVDKAESTISAAQRAFKVFKRAVVLIVIVTLALLAGTILLARNRRRAAIILALGGVTAIVIVRALIRRIVSKALLVVVDPDARVALRTTLNNLTIGLKQTVVVLIVLGIVTALVAYLSGSGEHAVAIRGKLGSAEGSVIDVIRAHSQAAAIGAYALALISLLFFGLTWIGLIVTAAFAALGIWLYALEPHPDTTAT